MGAHPDFEAFVAGCGDELVRFAYLLSHDRGRAEDLAQEALLKAHRKWSHVAALDHPEAYVRRIVLNEYLGWRRRRASDDSPVALFRSAIQVSSPAGCVSGFECNNANDCRVPHSHYFARGGAALDPRG